VRDSVYQGQVISFCLIVMYSYMSIYGNFHCFLLIYKYFVDMDTLTQIGQNLRQARQKAYPNDTLDDFALRIGVGRATLQRMEKGDLSVSLGKYFQAAALLGLDAPFHTLLKPTQSLFDD